MTVVSTSIDIAADPQRVWQVLTDFAAYPDWNPFIRSISGELASGERLTVQIKPPGGKGMTFTPIVLAADAGRELRWKGKLLVPGFFDGEHFFRLEQTTIGTHLDHGEKFSGIFVRLMGEESFKQIERGFVEMNQALQRRAER